MNHNIDKLSLPPFNPGLAEKVLTAVIREELSKTGLNRAIIGVSGGIDSALSLYLTARAIGPENITAILMPYKTSSPDSEKHGREACEKLGIDPVKEEITAMVEPYFDKNKGEISALRRGNIMARMRMIILYDYSAKENGLVIGTSNKTEILLGYSTLWGDMASAINPLGDLFKNQVRSLSAYLGVPDSIVKKPPSADLWQGQSDEEEMGISYDFADRVLYHWIDLAWTKPRVLEAVEATGHSAEMASSIFKRVSRSQFKRKMPVIAKVSTRTVDREFRYPRDWNL